MTTLLIDNHDSNTFNLFHLLARIEGREPEVVRNDEADWARSTLERFSKVVISAGPGRPDRPRDFGISRRRARRSRAAAARRLPRPPGARARATAATVERAPRPMHGRRSRIHHGGAELFEGIPQGFLAVRYHSLAVREPLPPALEVTARTASGTVMARAPPHAPALGRAVPPRVGRDRVGRGAAAQLLAALAAAAHQRPAMRAPRARVGAARPRPPGAATLELVVATVPRPRRRRDRVRGAVRRRARPRSGSTRASHGPGWAASRTWAPPAARSRRSSPTTSPPGELTLAPRRAASSAGAAAFLDWLDAALRRVVGRSSRLLHAAAGSATSATSSRPSAAARTAHRSPLPDAALLFADRLIAFDHETGEAHVVGLADRGGRARRAGVGRAHRARGCARCAPQPAAAPRCPAGRTAFALRARRPRTTCATSRPARRYLAAGESYEICLTNELRRPAVRRRARACTACCAASTPHRSRRSCALAGSRSSSSSPERFLALDRARPARGQADQGHARARRDAAARTARRRRGCAPAPRTAPRT